MKTMQKDMLSLFWQSVSHHMCCVSQDSALPRSRAFLDDNVRRDHWPMVVSGSLDVAAVCSVEIVFQLMSGSSRVTFRRWYTQFFSSCTFLQHVKFRFEGCCKRFSSTADPERRSFWQPWKPRRRTHIDPSGCDPGRERSAICCRTGPHQNTT